MKNIKTKLELEPNFPGVATPQSSVQTAQGLEQNGYAVLAYGQHWGCNKTAKLYLLLDSTGVATKRLRCICLQTAQELQ